MKILQAGRQFFQNHYPRDHLYIAGSITSLMVLILLIPDKNQEASNSGGIRSIPIPVVSQEQDPSQLVQSGTITPAESVAIEQIEAHASAWQNFEVASGDNLSQIFAKAGLSDRDLFRVLNSSDEAQILNNVYPGYQLNFLIPEKGLLDQLRVLKSPLEGYLFRRSGNDFSVEEIKKKADIRKAFKVGKITDSLFMAGQRENIPAAHLIEMANIFGGVIDFILDPREGDRFSILYNEEYLDGDLIGNGEIIATQFINQERTFTAIRYINEVGELGYYSPDGESMRKAFLRNPLDVFRISSNFNPRRRHPILNTIRAHKGTDYAAPNGTPIRATGDGRIKRASRYGSFGNLVIIEHAGGFETKYAHLSRYHKNTKPGTRVRQGDVIGYVGSTGGATGPHLHYEFLVNGVHQNPRTILDKLPKAESIGPEEMRRFKNQTEQLLSQFEDYNNGRLINFIQKNTD